MGRLMGEGVGSCRVIPYPTVSYNILQHPILQYIALQAYLHLPYHTSVLSIHPYLSPREEMKHSKPIPSHSHTCTSSSYEALYNFISLPDSVVDALRLVTYLIYVDTLLSLSLSLPLSLSPSLSLSIDGSFISYERPLLYSISRSQLRSQSSNAVLITIPTPVPIPNPPPSTNPKEIPPFQTKHLHPTAPFKPI